MQADSRESILGQFADDRPNKRRGEARCITKQGCCERIRRLLAPGTHEACRVFLCGNKCPGDEKACVGFLENLEMVILSVLAKDLGTEGGVTCHLRFFAEYRSE